jgi:hypothetical protein
MTLKLERAWSNRPYFHSEPSKGDVSQRVAAIFAMEDRHRRMCQLNVTEVNAPTLTLDPTRQGMLLANFLRAEPGIQWFGCSRCKPQSTCGASRDEY